MGKFILLFILFMMNLPISNLMFTYPVYEEFTHFKSDIYPFHDEFTHFKCDIYPFYDDLTHFKSDIYSVYVRCIC